MDEVEPTPRRAMDQVIPGLWVGDLSSVSANNLLEENNIKFIISAMRGRVKIGNPDLKKHAIPLDDVPDADVLEHLSACNALIEAALERGEGVLVHCQAGQSRSVTIVAAFLMYHQGIDRDAALAQIRQARPSIGPNEGFMKQLDIYYAAKFKVSPKDKHIRAFYLERSVQEVLNGDGSDLRNDFFAKFPQTPGTATPGIVHRRIRCKACRQELAAREHMMDHGQLSPPTPGVLSRAPSLGEASRHPRTSSHSEGLRMSKLNSPTTSRRPSAIGGLSGGLKMTSMTTETDSRPSSVRALSDSLRMTSSQNDESALADSDSEGEPIRTRNGTSAPEAEDFSTDDEEQGPSTSPLPSPPLLLSPSEISAQLPQSLAALRRSSLVAALRGSASSISSSRPISRSNSVIQATLPILLNPACSGYFVEPMGWMDSFLEGGPMAGKITCPNERCKAKLGNFDWAGVPCGCRQWVTPGFCISRSKVDECA